MEVYLVKRDMDLIREILLKIEDHPNEPGGIDLPIEGRSSQEISYHVKLLAQAGLIEALESSSFDGDVWEAKSLTWEGHEFLEASKDEGVWKKAKSIITNKGGGMVFEVLQSLVIDLAKQNVLGT